MRYRSPRPSSLHRGVTLVEMLVAVALLVLMMTVIVTIFASATGAVSGLQTFQQLDGDLRQLDITIRRDLIGVTARMTPPLDPRNNLGYFEYAENAFADLQGEDTDDYIRFTAKAPDGQPFTGRIWLNTVTTTPPANAPQPVLLTSQYAEIIYFLRNGNLYRRVLLIAPEQQAAVNGVITGLTANKFGLNAFHAANLGLNNVSWQGVNDLSAHPTPSGYAAALIHPIVLNTLGDLTNRENRAFYPRFANDYVTHAAGSSIPDGVPDDENPDANGVLVGDGVPDYHPVLYSQMSTATNPLVNEPSDPGRLIATDTMAFPYVYSWAYSKPDATIYGASTTGAGWIHSTDPSTTFTNAVDQLAKINHSPLESGDSLLPPTSPQTWFGFPTWKETLLPQWTDPYTTVSTGVAAPTTTNTGFQPLGLRPLIASAVPNLTANLNALPPMTSTYRLTPQLFNDGAGSDLFTAGATAAPSIGLWQAAWEDDLIMTGVRSFDVKIYDDSFPGFVDLGWGDDLRLQPITNPGTPPTGYLSQANGLQFLAGTPTVMNWNNTNFSPIGQTFAHEGRIPPLVNDFRFDSQYPALNLNVGDNQVSVQRLRRVWDTWSTDYSQAPGAGFNPTTKFPTGPPWTKPVYPSYPAPYPLPLRGLQIQIRVVDPRNERLKTLTIRQDFSDKL